MDRPSTSHVNHLVYVGFSCWLKNPTDRRTPLRWTYSVAPRPRVDDAPSVTIHNLSSSLGKTTLLFVDRYVWAVWKAETDSSVHSTLLLDFLPWVKFFKRLQEWWAIRNDLREYFVCTQEWAKRLCCFWLFTTGQGSDFVGASFDCSLSPDPS